MRIFVVSIMVITLSGCGSIISRTIPGQGHGNQYYPGVQWDMRDSAWRYIKRGELFKIDLQLIQDNQKRHNGELFKIKFAVV